MTPLERAARAICVAFDYDPDKDDEVGFGEPGDVNWNMFEDHARAVLQVIREPSDAMVEAGFFATPDVKYEGALHKVWAAMIDAALGEGL